MTFSFRSMLVPILVVTLVFTAGCSAITGEDGSTGPQEYHDDASDYLLTIDEIGDRWELNQTREPNMLPVNMESGRVIEAINDGDEVTVGVIVFNSPQNTTSFYEDQRTTYESQNITTTNQSLGKAAYSATALGITFVEIRGSNIYVQVYGNIHLSNIKHIGKTQIDKITDG